MPKLFDEELDASMQQLFDETIEAMQLAKVSPDLDDLSAVFAVALLKLKANNKKNDIQCKRMVIELIDDAGFKVKTGLFSNWYNRVKKDVGMA